MCLLNYVHNYVTTYVPSYQCTFAPTRNNIIYVLPTHQQKKLCAKDE